jgi:hypothetical protein
VGTKWSAMFSGVEKYLEEKPWKFRSVYIITIPSEVELIQDAICPLRGKVCLGFFPSLDPTHMGAFGTGSTLCPLYTYLLILQ